jgi:hypothetical protein
MFDAFTKELAGHRDGGFHHLGGALEQGDVNAWFQEHGLRPPATYVDFLCQIGLGSFFGGALTIYPFSSRHSRSVESELSRLGKAATVPIFSFGYDGTTELCYCFEAESGEDAVYWFSWEEKLKRSLSPNFREWIETKPTELFKEQIYADVSGYFKTSR